MTPEAQLIVALATIAGATALLLRAWARNVNAAADLKLKDQAHKQEIERLQLQNERDREKRHNETEDRLTRIVEQNAELFKAQLGAANEKILRLETQLQSTQTELKSMATKNDEFLVVNNSLLSMNDKLTEENKLLTARNQELEQLVPRLRVQINELEGRIDMLEKHEAENRKPQETP